MLTRITAIALGFVLVGAAAQTPRPLRAAEDEAQLLSILQSDQAPAAKDRACLELRTRGTAKSVPALAKLLTDEQLSHSARCALETMPCSEAGAALREALARTTGRTQAGLIDSVGLRRDPAAVATLTGLLGESDLQVASAAAAALGKIGSADAIRSLRSARPKAPAALQAFLSDGLLMSAELARSAGDQETARAIYAELSAPQERRHVRVAAQRGLILVSGPAAADLVRQALAGTDQAARLAVLRLLHELPGEELPKACAASLSGLAPDTQVAVIEALRQRGSVATIPALLATVSSPAAEVRIAALRALGTLGDATSVACLAEAAARSQGAEQEAAREALARLRGGRIREAILTQLEPAQLKVKGELLRALGFRRDAAANSTLLKFAQDSDASLRTAALQSLALTADGAAVAELVKLLSQVSTEADLAAVEKALAAACGRSAQPQACAAPVLTALAGASTPVRCALLRVAGVIGGAESLAALRAGTQAAEPAVQEAAIRTLADAGGLEVTADLLRLGQEAANARHRVFALRGYWRVVGLAAQQSAEQRLQLCAAGLKASLRPEERKLGLTELGKIIDLQALQLALSFLDEASVRAEAALAVTQIARELTGSHRAEATAALQRVLAAAPEGNARAEAEAALKRLEEVRDFLTAWQAAGPFEQPGKNYSDLFDVAFPPEDPAAKNVAWRRLPVSVDPQQPGLLDLLKFFGGEQRVAYARTRVFVERGQPVRFELGSDDGIKVWLNGQLIHSNNTARAVTPGADKAEATLQAGWNTLLVKVTQNNQGWGFCLRLSNRDGGHVEGLRVEP